jgi:D-alanine-D-alanine ligase
MDSKKIIAVIFGGQSSEHEVSCVSAVTIISNVDSEKYDTLLIGITKEGCWKKVDSTEQIKDGSWRNSRITAVISPDRTQQAVLLIDNDTEAGEQRLTIQKIDVVFPALHGLFGEDGTLQGLLELSGIPYVGCGVLASALAMDKLFTKQIVARLGIRQAHCVPVFRRKLNDCAGEADRVEAELSYPVFVKPSNAGSSCGVTKAHNRTELLSALTEAAKFDRKILVEEAIVGRELECAVLGGETISAETRENDKAKASGIGEILAAAEFYDYDAKYNNEDSKTVISPELPEGKAQEIAEDAVRIFTALDGFGLARVDFFLEESSGEIVFNEINTLPGFTSISMYPMLWEAKGMNKKQLVDTLIRLAFQRA